MEILSQAKLTKQKKRVFYVWRALYTALFKTLFLDVKYFIARILFGTLSFFNQSPDAEAVGRVELSEEELAGGLPHRVHLQQRGRRQQHLDRSLSTSAAARRPAATP